MVGHESSPYRKFPPRIGLGSNAGNISARSQTPDESMERLSMKKTFPWISIYKYDIYVNAGVIDGIFLNTGNKGVSGFDAAFSCPNNKATN